MKKNTYFLLLELSFVYLLTFTRASILSDFTSPEPFVNLFFKEVFSEMAKASAKATTHLFLVPMVGSVLSKGSDSIKSLRDSSVMYAIKKKLVYEYRTYSFEADQIWHYIVQLFGEERDPKLEETLKRIWVKSYVNNCARSLVLNDQKCQIVLKRSLEDFLRIVITNNIALKEELEPVYSLIHNVDEVIPILCFKTEKKLANFIEETSNDLSQLPIEGELFDANEGESPEVNERKSPIVKEELSPQVEEKLPNSNERVYVH